jgi:hypothetical protein
MLGLSLGTRLPNIAGFGIFGWLPIRNQVSYSACQIRPTVSYSFDDASIPKGNCRAANPRDWICIIVASCRGTGVSDPTSLARTPPKMSTGCGCVAMSCCPLSVQSILDIDTTPWDSPLEVARNE